jgi:hypothetical protein
MEIEYCPTNAMIADFMTKPLVGKKFIHFRDQIVNAIPAASASRRKESHSETEAFRNDKIKDCDCLYILRSTTYLTPDVSKGIAGGYQSDKPRVQFQQ